MHEMHPSLSNVHAIFSLTQAVVTPCYLYHRRSPEIINAEEVYKQVIG